MSPAATAQLAPFWHGPDAHGSMVPGVDVVAAEEGDWPKPIGSPTAKTAKN